MGKGLLDPKVDFVFKNIFGSEKHPEILISFFNAIIKPTIPIVGVEIKGTEMTKQFIDDKYSRLDVKATTSNNEIINIEIQLKDELIRMSNNEEQRALYEMRAKILKDKVSALNKARREGIEEGINSVALNMKKAGIDLMVIQQTTGLSMEVIERLK